jgi:hypothetical protein
MLCLIGMATKVITGLLGLGMIAHARGVAEQQ